MKKEKIVDIVFSFGISLSKRLAKTSCLSVNSYYMLDVFRAYQLGKDYNNPYLSIDRDNKKR